VEIYPVNEEDVVITGGEDLFNTGYSRGKPTESTIPLNKDVKILR
jgi:hypothetical protein